MDDFLNKVSDDELRAMGYATKEEFEETVVNLEWYLNNDNGCLINQDYAGTTGNDGVKRGVLGFPIFDDNDKVFTATLNDELYMASDNIQFKECTRQLDQAIKEEKVDGSIFNNVQRKQIKNGSKRVSGYTWYHDKVTGKM